jgi:hypothetical protein
MPDPDDLDSRADGGGTAAGATSRLVHGLVRDQLDRPLDGVTVRVLDRDVRSETLLGSAPTASGQYEIRYLVADLQRGSADMVVCRATRLRFTVNPSPNVSSACTRGEP